MGILDRFTGGDEEEEDEELQENIQKIRERVQERKGGERRPPRRREEGGGEDLSPPAEAPISRGVGGPSGQEQELPPEPADQEEPLPPERAGETRRGEGRRQEPKEMEEPEETVQEEEELEEGMPHPPQVRDIDVPDIEKGPLFITVERFRDALETVGDLREFASEMDDRTGSLESTLQEDRATEQEIRDLLDEAEKSSEDLRDLVSP
ncbi:MAG: hypothetical protein ABEI07_00830 [Candidatus Nanohaloarchaea archaeon]